MPTAEETLRIENFKIKQFLRLGYSITEAMDAISDDVDWHEVESMIDKGCARTLALKIVR